MRVSCRVGGISLVSQDLWQGKESGGWHPPDGLGFVFQCGFTVYFWAEQK